MSTKIVRKTLDEALDGEPEINPQHVNDWHYCTSAMQFINLQRILPLDRCGNFNFKAATSAPKSIKFRQRDTDFTEGKRGDYLFVDQNGGRMAVPFKLFKLYFS